MASVCPMDPQKQQIARCFEPDMKECVFGLTTSLPSIWDIQAQCILHVVSQQWSHRKLIKTLFFSAPRVVVLQGWNMTLSSFRAFVGKLGGNLTFLFWSHGMPEESHVPIFPQVKSNRHHVAQQTSPSFSEPFYLRLRGGAGQP